mgnify:FL=1
MTSKPETRTITAGLAMFFGRYLSIVIQLAIAGSLMRKQFVNDSIGTLRTDSATFTIGLVCVVYIFAALTFLAIDSSLQYIIKGLIILVACSLDMRKYLVKK